MSKPPRLKTLKPRLAMLQTSGLVRQRTGTALWRPDSERGTAAQRGYGTAWRRLRAQAMERDKGLCQDCLERGAVTAAQQVDHVVPKMEGGRDELDNLRCLCRACHDEKTRIEMTRGRM